jgi:DNA polymerase elongation subunit (family B)
MKLLFLDVETSPNTAHIWGLRDQYINPNHILESSYVLCWAAKWYESDEIMFDSVLKNREKNMLKKIHQLISEADAVVHYNGTRFDMPVLNKEFLLNNMLPPEPYKQLDLLKVVRKEFRFASNKLDHIAQRLNLGKKTEHEGYTLWVKCMNKDKEAWAKMEEYNKQDVLLLERLYDRLLPWLGKQHPNRNLFDGQGCATCGSNYLQKRGFSYTITGKFQRYQCMDCGSWSKSNKSLQTRAELSHA